MSLQDETLDDAVDELFNEMGTIDPMVSDREPAVTADGFDYGVLLWHFTEVSSMPGTIQPQPGHFLAPGPSCTFTYH